jgi:hypothetical protein
MTKNPKKKLQLKIITYFFDQKLQFTYPWASVMDVQATEEASALRREHSALQNMNFRNIFLFLWVMFAHLDPDPDPDPDLGSTVLIESGSNPYPDPKHR